MFYEGNYQTHSLRLAEAPEPGKLPSDLTVNLITHHESAGHGVPDALLQVGMGCENKAPLRALWLLGKLGINNMAILEALPYSKIDPEPARIEELATQASLLAAEFITRQSTTESLLSVYADSQAGPSATWAVNCDSGGTLYKSLDINHSLGVQTGMRKKDFVTGMVLTGFQRDQMDRGTHYIGRRSAFRAVQDYAPRRWRDGVQGKQLEAAFAFDIIKPLSQIAARLGSKNVGVFANDDDKLFRVEHTRDRLQSAGLGHLLHVIPHSSHSTPASYAGADQVLYMVRNREATNAIYG